MSISPDSRESSFSSHVTSVPETVEPRSLMPGGYYVTNNDWLFGTAARQAALGVSGSSEASAVYMTVGNGGFESMSALLPREVAILHVDRDPKILIANKMARSAILESDSRQEFYQKIKSHSDISVGRAGDIAETWQEKYLYQRSRWSISGRFVPWFSSHFLASEKSFRQAKDGLDLRDVAYCAMDIFETDQRLTLARKLSEVGARVMILNLTNVMDPYYNRDHTTVIDIVNDLPTAEDLIIMQSTNKSRARASRIEAPYKREGAKTSVNKQRSIL